MKTKFTFSFKYSSVQCCNEFLECQKKCQKYKCQHGYARKLINCKCKNNLTLTTSEADIPALRKLPCGVGSRYTGETVCQRQVSEAGIPALFSNAYWHRNAQVIEIQTRQQLKNNFFHETQRIFMNKFCIWTPSGQRTS